MNRLSTCLLLLVAFCYVADCQNVKKPATGKGCKSLYGLTYEPFALDLKNICLPTDQVRADMEIIVKHAKSVRTYNMGICLENTRIILDIAKANGVTVLLGMWIDLDELTNQQEIVLLPILMAEYGDIIEAVIVGNEANFIQEVPMDKVIAYLRETKKVLRQNGFKHMVSAADVWPVWESEEGFKLAEEVDFICLNMQPYWEGWDVACRKGDDQCLPAGEYVNLKAQGLEDFFGKPTWVCETGWPLKGERCCTGSRDNALSGLRAGPSPKNATAFVQSFVTSAQPRGKPYWIHSIFDSDWKRIWFPCDECRGKQVTKFEGDQCGACEVGYAWGFYTSDREKKSNYKFPKAECEG